MSTVTAPAALRRRTGPFLLHLLEMTVAMMVGMIALGILAGAAAAAAGSSLDRVRVSQPDLSVLAMAVAMSATMVAWMRFRGEGARAAVEMTAAMFVPAVVLIACYRLGVVHARAVCGLECAAMVPATAAAMLLRPLSRRPGAAPATPSRSASARA